MTGTRNRSAWIWVAIAAIAFASAARAEAGLQNARTYAHPVLEFLAKNHGQFPPTNSASPRFVQAASGRRFGSMFHSAGTGTWLAVLPVLFVGLVSPLSVTSAVSTRSLSPAPAAPLLPVSFQRPPPHSV
ncbi:MAG TPA: hypothetical protein VK716_11740 [Terracidiphilus sp.]|jgi:hypothetical protein|nr:hypothetical protein [Terracidiphilus sp.]